MLRKTNVLCLSAVEDPLFHLIWDFCTGPFLVSTASEQIWEKKQKQNQKDHNNIDEQKDM